MANGYSKFKKGINVEPLASSVSAKGDIAYNSSTDKLEIYNGAVDPVVTEGTTQTLSSKTLASPVMTGVSTFANGSSSTPSIVFSSSSTTGFYRNAGSIGTAVGGNKGPTIIASTVQSTIQLSDTSSTKTGQLVMGSSDSTLYIAGDTGTSAGGQVRFYGASHATKPSLTEFTVGNTVSATIDASGKFGIGMTPTKTLDITGTLGLTGAATFGTSVILSNSTNDRAKIEAQNVNSGNNAEACLQLNNNVSNAFVSLFGTSFSTSGPSIADGMGLRCDGAGGITVSASNSSGAVKLYTNGTLGATLDSSQKLTIAGALTTAGINTLSNLTTAGPVITSSSGVLTSEATLAISRGGTGQSTKAAAMDALSPNTTKGDILTYSSTNARLGVGTDGLFLKADSSQTTGLVWASTTNNLAVTTKTADYTALTSDDIILVNTNAVNITLPAASNTGKVLRIKKIGSDLNIVTITRAGSDTIEGSTTTKLNTQYEMITLVADGSATWEIVSRDYPRTWTSYTPTTTGITVGNGTVGGQWRRVGDSLEIQASFVLGSTSSVTGNITFAIPNTSTWTIDTSKLASSSSQIQALGSSYAFVSGAALYSGAVLYNTTTTIVMAGPSSSDLWRATIPSTFNTSSYLSLRFTAPITNWN